MTESSPRITETSTLGAHLKLYAHWFKRNITFTKTLGDVFNRMALAYRQEVNMQEESQVSFHFFVQAAVVNSFIWWEEMIKTKQEHLYFRLNLINQLKRMLFPAIPAMIPDPQIRCFPRPLTAEQKQKRTCQEKGCPNRPWRFCPACNALLCEPCMQAGHPWFLEKSPVGFFLYFSIIKNSPFFQDFSEEAKAGKKNFLLFLAALYWYSQKTCLNYKILSSFNWDTASN